MIDQYGRWYPDYPGQQPYQDPAYMRAIGQPVQGQHPGMQPGAQMSSANQPAQDLTPTIRTDIKQVESIEAISKCQPAPGTTGVYMTKDDKIIVFRTMYANGEYTDKIYDERPPAPPAPKFNPAEYVRRDEAEKFIKETIAAYIASTQQAKIAKEEK